MTNSDKNHDLIETFIGELSFLNKKKFFILTFLFLGLLKGYFVYKKESNPVNDIYLSTAYGSSNVIHNEIIIDLLNMVNGMDIPSRVKNLNISEQTAASIIDIHALLQPLPIIKGDLFNRSKIYFHIKFNKKSLNNKLLKGISYYVNSNQYLIEKLEEYNTKQNNRKELLTVVNKEIMNLEESRKSNQYLNEYNYNTNPQLFNLKSALNNDIFRPFPFSIIYFSNPTDITERPSLFIKLLSYSFFGIMISIAGLYLLKFLKKIKSLL